MSNVGIFPGLNPSAWKNYVPVLRGLSFLGSGITPPLLLDPRNTIGRYLITNQGLVKVQAQITFAAGDTIGSGDTYYGISLPFPANRSSGGADLPIGQMFLDQGAAANPRLNMIGQASLADPGAPGAQQGQEDFYVQAFISKTIAFGTAALTSGTTAVTVTHGLGQTPASYDIKVVPTNNPSTNPAWGPYVDTITATQFNINVKASSTTTPATFAWKIESEPSAIQGVRMSSTTPWAWAAGHVIGMNIEYEARR